MRAAALALLLGLAASCAPERPELAGPPCPALSAEAFAERAVQPLKSTRFAGVFLERRHGSVDCRAVGSSGSGGADGAPFCRLSAPALLHVRAGETDAYFAPPAGRPVLIAVEDRQVRCVLDEPRALGGGGPDAWRPPPR